jgi:hypothetical protein
MPEEPQLPDVEFSMVGGYYDEGVEVELYAPGCRIFYTLDGRTPSQYTIPYQGPITIEKTTALRVVAYEGDVKSIIQSQTYFINEPETDLATVSISISPYLLFDPEKGLFVKGNNVIDTLWKKPGANFWSRRELAANIEIFEADGHCVHNNLSGFRLFGGMSRLFPQKSLAIVARKRYGKKRFSHPIFGDDGLKKFKFLVLRNSGSDFGRSHFRDALMTSLVDDWDIEKQDVRPAHVYINGDYWGIYNIREKVNRYFVAGHHEVDKDSIDLLEHKITRKRGSKAHYKRLLSFLEDNDLSDPANYAYVKSQMDVDNFINYQIAQIYFDNRDAGGNIKFWRPQTPNGRWRWILYDTDWGFGLHSTDAQKHNALDFHTKPDGPVWPNPPWSTFILRKLLENPDFERAFVLRFADHLNVSFSEARVMNAIDRFYRIYDEEIPRHHKRWRLSNKTWKQEVQELRTFALERPRYVRMHLMERFNTGALRDLRLTTTDGGQVVLNDNLEVRGAGINGQYFENLPISLKAIPDYGYRFSHWEGIDAPPNMRDLFLSLTDPKTTIRAVFEKYAHPLVNKVIVNEVCPLNRQSKDWLEIFNYTNQRISLNGWVLTDSNNEFVFPDISLGPNDYLVVCEDSLKFMKQYPSAYNVIGGLGFGLNKRKETIRLFSRLGAAVDSFAYQVPPTDSTFVLSLLLPTLDNSDAENWEMRTGIGSPNAPNPYYVESRIRAVQEGWMQVGVAAGVFLLGILLLILRTRGIL